MTTTDRAALREAVEAALVAFDNNVTHLPLVYERRIAATLRAWLDSGLSDAERETVRGVVAKMDGTPAGKMYPHHWAEEWANALRPIAEGK